MSILEYILFFYNIYTIIISTFSCERSVNMKIGTRLRQYRKAKEISIYKLSKETDVSQNHISAIENDIRQPTIEMLERLITPMGITLAEFFNDNENASFLTSDERNLVENYRFMSKENSDLIQKLSKALTNRNK